MQYRALEPGIEVNGRSVWSIVDGFGAFTQVGSKYLLGEGIGEPGPDGVVRIEPSNWYPQDAWLRAFERIGNELGDSALHLIGLKIPANAIFPPWMVDVDSAIQSIDVAYHLNHRKRGEVMFEMASGKMLEGIGHYGYSRPEPRQNRLLSVCNDPYPCAFDLGILTTMARKFARDARVDHQPGTLCRKQGGEGCSYLITW